MHIQYFAVEISPQSQKSLSPVIMNKVFNFPEKKADKLWTVIRLANRNIHTTHFGIDTIYGNYCQIK